MRRSRDQGWAAELAWLLVFVVMAVILSSRCGQAKSAEITIPRKTQVTIPQKGLEGKSAEEWAQPKVPLPRVYMGLFGAEWCAPCLAARKRLEQFYPECKGETVAKRGWGIYPWFYWDVDKHPGVMERYGFKTVPVAVMIVDGVVWEVKDGTDLTPGEFITWFAKARAKITKPKARSAGTVTYRSYTIEKAQPQQRQTTTRTYTPRTYTRGGCGNPSCRMCYGR